MRLVPFSFLGPTVAPTLLRQSFTATDGAGQSFNTSTISLDAGPSPTLLMAVFHAEFGTGSFNEQKVLWEVKYNGVRGRLLLMTDGYEGGAGNSLFRVYYWQGVSGVHDLVTSLTTNGTTVSSIANELTVLGMVFSGAANTLFPFREIDKDISASNRSAESVTVDSAIGDLVCHLIGSSLTTQGTLGSGETFKVHANDATDDASITLSTKPGAAGTTTVSSSGWASTFPLQGIAFSIKPAGSAEDHSLRSDNCARSNESPVSNGGTWTTPVGASTVGAVNLISNQLKGNTAGENIAKVNSPSFPANQRAAIKYVGAQFGGVCVRIQSSSASCYFLSSNGSTGLEVYKVTDNGSSLSYSSLWSASVTNARALLAGDWLELEATGTSTTTLKVYWNGILLQTINDSTSPYTSGQPGARVFFADPFASEFEASSLPIRG